MFSVYNRLKEKLNTQGRSRGETGGRGATSTPDPRLDGDCTAAGPAVRGAAQPLHIQAAFPSE